MKSFILTMGLAAAVLSGSAMAANEMPVEAKKGGCIACHAIDRVLVGPPWAEVAKKYQGDAGARDLLIEKVSKGGKGVWSGFEINGKKVTAAMPAYGIRPYFKKNPDDIAKLVDFILALEK